MARRTRHRVLVLLPALALALGATACAESINTGGSATGEISLINEGKLTTCTHLPYKPFQMSEGGKVVGFDVDLVDLVADELGVKQEITDTPFEGIQSGELLNSGKCDVAAAGMTILPVREQNMDFSDPYFEATQALLVKKGSPYRSLADLRGKKLGTQLGTTGEEYAKQNQDANGYEIIQFEDLGLLTTAVLTGQVDAAINDNGVLYDFVKDNPETEVSVEFDTGEQYGIAVRTGNDALRGKINDVLKKAKESGEYDRIYEKWFGKKPDKK
ncbi:basic amino acid ABC transporter substrate-binding protein [Longimycelium tulufanense]|uniref:Basic amino acid ABC transporter substrate-binding protein n=1 Tax=Longimycelium tulufanense TaxID=907463 RepID=A0A8J3FUD8_9PSEU|nr:basic amino acid ABC transporter substrate-binding protein [Longimycelium tulufanense]GGM57731.1 basic amino acid ABC transporter substrate-binding protein [Longimycelium tulufanense]